MSRYPYVKFTAAFTAGILLHGVWGLNLTFIAAGVCLLLLLLFLKQTSAFIRTIRTLIVYSLIIEAGILTTEINVSKYSLLPPEIIKEDNCRVYGTVDEVYLIREKELSFLIAADSLKISSTMYKGELKLISKIKSGEQLSLDSLYSLLYPGNKIIQTGYFNKGKDRRNPGEFDYNGYLRSEGISGQIISYYADQLDITNRDKSPHSFITDLRRGLDKQIIKLHGKTAAELLRGLLLADRSGISYETKESFINTGVIHILAVSGLHTGYIALIFLLIFGRTGLLLKSLFTIAGLILFLFITDMPVSVFRAVVMGIVLITALLTGRSTNIFNSLAIAAFVILFLRPSEIYSPGFQLSFAAVLSIGYIFPLIKEKINDNFTGKLRIIILFAAVSLAAQIGTLPLTIYYFGKISLVAVILNLAVIPLAGVIIIIGATALVLSPVSIFLAQAYAAANELFISVLFLVTDLAGKWSFSYLRITEFSMPDSILIYAFIVFFLLILKNLTLKGILTIFSLIIFCSVILTSLDDKQLMPDGKLSIMMIDVGQGDSFLIKFPDEKTMLIDAGDANREFDSGERVIAPLLDYLGIDKVDYGFITHLDNDHFGGMLSLINSGRIRHLLKPLADNSASEYRLERYLREIWQPYSCYKNEILLSSEARVYSLFVPDDFLNWGFSTNDRSGVLKITYGKTSFLFTGDLGKKGEKIYMQRYGNWLNSDILKVAHHGSRAGTSEEFINFAGQDYALISAGYKNKFKHPADEVITRLENSGSRILRTDINGAVLIQSDGNKIDIIDWKN